MKIKAFPGLTIINQQVDALQVRKKPPKFRLAFQHNRSAERLRLGNDSASQDRITKALFRMEQQAAVFERLAVPTWCFKVAALHLVKVPARFISDPTCGKISKLQQHQGPVQLDLSILW